jgi:hypothetical protein
VIATIAFALVAPINRVSLGEDTPSSTSSFGTPSAAADSLQPRPPAQLRAAVTETLRAAAVAKDPQERDQAGRQLVSIFLELEHDKQLPRDDRAKLHAQVRSRLLTLEKALRAERTKEDEHSGSAPVAAKAAKVDATVLNAPADVLAQVAAPAVRGVARPLVVNGGLVSAVVGQSQSPDYGQDLVDLIHAVIQPSTWDVNGGPGSVVYYRNFRVLVVTAPSEVHSDLGDLLGQLRK